MPKTRFAAVRALLALLAVFVLGSAGCQSKEPKATPVPESATGDTTSGMRSESGPPQPSGAQIGTSDSLMNVAAPKLEEWIAMWRASLPGFAVDSLWMDKKQRWSPDLLRKIEGDIRHRETPTDVAFEILGIRSPDGRRILDVDRYLVIEPVGDDVDESGEPDSQPWLIDRRAGTEALLKTCGTDCSFHWGTWLSPSRFALAGMRDGDDGYGHWVQGQIWIYSLDDSMVAGYVTRIVTRERAGGYAAARHEWLRARARALRGTRT
jgi:hypothetical protein